MNIVHNIVNDLLAGTIESRVELAAWHITLVLPTSSLKNASQNI